MPFEFDPQRIRPLAEALAGDFAQVKGELLIFIGLSQRIGRRRPDTRLMHRGNLPTEDVIAPR